MNSLEESIGNILEGRYEITKKIGKGGFAYVYEARDLKNDSIVAVKKIINNLKYGHGEIKAMKFLNDESKRRKVVVPLLNYFTYEKYILLILPFYENGSLRDYLRRNQNISQYTIAFILKQLIKALQYLRDRGYVHRDLTTANVLISKIKEGVNINDRKVYVVLADFGLAKQISTPVLGTTVGTKGFMHPDIENGKAYGPEVDVFSLGCIFYSMIMKTDPPLRDRQLNKAQMIDDFRRLEDEIIYSLFEKLFIKNKTASLNELSRHKFITQYDISDFDSQITLHKSSHIRSGSQCRHNFKDCNCPDKENVRNKLSYQRDSAIGSLENQVIDRRIRRYRSANDLVVPVAREPSLKEDRCDPWPLPEYFHLVPYTLVADKKGRFIFKSDEIIFEKLGDSGFITLIMKVINDNTGDQMVRVYEPRVRSRLPKEDDPLIETSEVIEIFKRPNMPSVYSIAYGIIFKAIGIIKARIPKIDYVNIYNVHHQQAKLMQNGDFRFLFPDGKIFVRKDGKNTIDSMSKNGITSMTRDEEDIFLRAESYLKRLDDLTREELGSCYKTQTMIGQRENGKTDDIIPRREDRYDTGTFTTREGRSKRIISEPTARRRLSLRR